MANNQFRFEARQWLQKSDGNFIASQQPDEAYDFALVEDLYRAGAVRVEVGIVTGEREDHNEADTLYIYLPESREAALNIMLLVALQHGDEVEFVEGDKDIVRLWWD